MTIPSVSDMDELPNLSSTSAHHDMTAWSTCSDQLQTSANPQVSSDANSVHFEDHVSMCTAPKEQSVEDQNHDTLQLAFNCTEDSSKLSEPKAGTSSSSGATTSVASSLPSDSHFNKFSGHCTRNQKRLFKAFHQKKIKRVLQEMDVWDDSRPVNAHWAPKRSSVSLPETHPSEYLSKEDFLSRCGLVSSSSAQRLKSAIEKHDDVDLDCQIVAVEGPICGEPLQSPRTTRSLMSQLSRESSEAVRRRLSLCLDSEEGSESENLDTAVVRRSVQVSLLAIDFTSPLGMRLKKHMKGDLVVPPITDIEQHCMTIPVLDEMAAKLRHRASEYPIMSRKKKGIVTGYCHMYKFNKAERKEFMKTLKTGLNARSRQLLQQTKKCFVSLSRLRKEIIRYWTVKRRTIVHEEIAIDDDISIVQVDVPEHLFNAVQKLTVPAHNRAQYKESVIESKYNIAREEAYPIAHKTLGASAHPHSGRRSLSPHISCPSYPSSSLRSSSPAQGPVPQFLVKQVSKNWTENGQESQKLVFVPLEETSHSQRPNVSVRNMTVGPLQRPFKSSSGGNQKSLPRHLRPCPKSRRKQLMQGREDSCDDFVIETASSSSDEDCDSAVQSRPKKPKKESIYPLSMSTAASWRMPDKPVPQMLHIANSTSASVPVSSSLVSFPAGIVPVPWEHHMEASSGRGRAQQHSSSVPVHLVAATAAAASDSTSELRKNPYTYSSARGVSSDASLSLTFTEGVDDRNRTVIETPKPNISQQSSGTVCGAADCHKEQLVSSTPRLVSALQQPNFLHPHPPKLYDPNSKNSQCHSHHSVKQSTQQGSVLKASVNMPPLVYNPPVLHRHPGPSAVHNHHQQPDVKGGSGHQPSILRNLGKLQSPPSTSPDRNAVASKHFPVAGQIPPKPSPIGGQSSSDKTRSSRDWTVVRACDDDVVEVICIDDDD